jgi:hypothetical protein
MTQDRALLAEERLHWMRQTRLRGGSVRNGGRYSTQALLLFTDLEKAFIAGAWVSAIVISYAIVDASLRTARGDYQAHASKLYGSDAELDRLRGVRNELVHQPEPGSPSLVWTVAGHGIEATHAALEDEARRALAYRQVFKSS